MNKQKVWLRHILQVSHPSLQGQVTKIKLLIFMLNISKVKKVTVRVYTLWNIKLDLFRGPLIWKKKKKNERK